MSHQPPNKRSRLTENSISDNADPLFRNLDSLLKDWAGFRSISTPGKEIDLPPQEILVHTMWLSQVEKEHYHVVREACIKNMEKFNIFRYDFKLRDFDQHACNEMILPVENLIKACSYFILSPENCTDIQKNKMTNKQVINTLLINASRDSEETERKFINALNEMLLYILKRTENIFSEAKGKLLPDSPSFDEGADRVGILLSLKSGLRTTRLFLVDAVSKIIKKTPNEIIDIVISTFTDTCEHNLRRCLFCKPAVIINQFNRKLSDLNVPKESIAFSSLEEKHFRHFERKTFETVLISYLVLHEHLTNYPPKDGYQSVLLDAMTLEFQDGTPLAQFPSSVLNLQTELKEKIGKQLYLKSLKKFENTDQPFDERCPVCFEDFEDLWSVLQCGHCICPICIHKLGESATTLCPVCRQNASFTDALYVDLNTKGIYSTKVYSVVRQLIKIKKEDSSAKSLVFSNWTEHLCLLEQALQKNDIAFVNLCCDKHFQKNLDLFKNSNINVLLLPLNEGINGLNLIEATHILLMEPALDNSKVLQAIGCVRRIGQTKKTMVHQFVLENTIEENIHNVYKENPLRSLGDFSVENLIALCNHG